LKTCIRGKTMSELQTRTARRRATAAANDARIVELAKELCNRFGDLPWYKAKGRKAFPWDRQEFWLAHAKDMLKSGVVK